MKFDFDLAKELDEVMKNVEIKIGMTLAEAAEKQIPKKPTMIYTDKLDITVQIPSCPVCGNYYIDDEDDYCHKCGQKLNWGD